MAYEMKGAAGAKGRPRGGIVPGARPGSGSAATGMKGMNSKGGAENENDEELQADHELLTGHPMGGKKGSLYGGGPGGTSLKGKGKQHNFRTTPSQQPQMNKHAVALAAAAVDPAEFGEDQLAKVYEGVDAGDEAGENNLLAETSSRRPTNGAGNGASSESTLNYGHFDLPDVEDFYHGMNNEDEDDDQDFSDSDAGSTYSFLTSTSNNSSDTSDFSLIGSDEDGQVVRDVDNPNFDVSKVPDILPALLPERNLGIKKSYAQKKSELRLKYEKSSSTSTRNDTENTKCRDHDEQLASSWPDKLTHWSRVTLERKNAKTQRQLARKLKRERRIREAKQLSCAKVSYS